MNGTDIDRSKGSSIGSPSLTFEVDTTDACVPLPTITIYHNDTPKTQCDNTQCSYSVESAGDIYASVDLGTAYSGVQMPMFPLDTTRYTLFGECGNSLPLLPYIQNTPNKPVIEAFGRGALWANKFNGLLPVCLISSIR